ncbi:hypothetical protein [Oceanobacillus oncorhynchi]|uniref:hypothetical protein n=2 Tax=Oceanobacillus TaxID=182709 RepID=UPI002F96B854
MIIVNVVATRKKNMIMVMIGVKKTTIMMIITNAEKIATKVVVRKNPVIVLINSGKKISPHGCGGFKNLSDVKNWFVYLSALYTLFILDSIFTDLSTNI